MNDSSFWNDKNEANKVILKLNEFPTIICNDYLDYVNININANVESLPLNYEYKFCIYIKTQTV